jgi:hypothetical protein
LIIFVRRLWNFGIGYASECFDTWRSKHCIDIDSSALPCERRSRICWSRGKGLLHLGKHMFLLYGVHILLHSRGIRISSSEMLHLLIIFLSHRPRVSLWNKSISCTRTPRPSSLWNTADASWPMATCLRKRLATANTTTASPTTRRFKRFLIFTLFSSGSRSCGVDCIY